jgi:hypothetical protein
MGDIVPRDQLVKQGMKGLGGVAGGIGLFILKAFTGGAVISLPGLIVGGIVAVVGLAIGSSREDRKAGMVVTAAGVLTAVASLPLVRGLGSTLLTLGGIGLLGMGIYSLAKFLANLRRRM